MVTKTELCSYTDNKIYPGRGRRHVAKDGRTYYFISTKARSLFHQKIKPVKLTWTQAWRRHNKKIRVDELQKKRSRKTTRVQKAVVGMSLDEIKRRKAETRDDRDKKHDAAIKEVKDRKLKQIQAKKQEKAKVAKVAAPSKAAAKQQNAPKKAPAATAARGKKWSVRDNIVRSWIRSSLLTAQISSAIIRLIGLNWHRLRTGSHFLFELHISVGLLQLDVSLVIENLLLQLFEI